MSPDRRAADRLNDCLDAAAMRTATQPRDLDPALGTTVERFFAADDAPAPSDVRVETIGPNLDTLVLLPEEKRFYMVWRGTTTLSSLESMPAEIVEIKTTCLL